MNPGGSHALCVKADLRPLALSPHGHLWRTMSTRLDAMPGSVDPRVMHGKLGSQLRQLFIPWECTISADDVGPAVLPFLCAGARASSIDRLERCERLLLSVKMRPTHRYRTGSQGIEGLLSFAFGGMSSKSTSLTLHASDEEDPLYPRPIVESRQYNDN